MRLRNQTLLFLFLFGLAPLVLLVSITMPLVFDRIEDFYHGAYLQNLRADFRDLDQHIASRQEMLRLLAKLPEPGLLMKRDEREDMEIDEARAGYVEWTNRILDDQLDVSRVVFADNRGRPQFWLERDPKSLLLRPTTTSPEPLPEAFIESISKTQPGAIAVSPIHVDHQGGPFNFLTLDIAAPIVLPHDNVTVGMVYITVDVGGMARAYSNTLWVRDDGSFLLPSETGDRAGNAFEEFPGLEEKFSARRLALWRSPGGNRQMIWVPMFATEDRGVLWVGRTVDTSPLAALQNALVLRGLIVVVVVILVIWLLASWLAGRTARFGDELTRGIERMLEDETASFRWSGTHELRELGQKLSRLAEIHARNSRNLRAHARELEQSNRYKSEFLANVSHELRTPLNSILLLSKMLAGKAHLGPDERHQADVIHRAGQDLKDLIENILDLSRIEAGETTVNPEPIDLPQLLEDLLELVRPQFEEKGLPLVLEVEDGAPTRLVSDASKLRQIVKNFLSNSVKFTRQGGVRVRLRHGDDTRPLRIDVVDTGIGIPEAKQQIIFEAFKQADGATNRRYGGTGLGLNISRRLAALLGGAISVSSKAGDGATFSLLLPQQVDALADGTQPSVEPAVSAEEDNEPPIADFSPHRVLVVEPDLHHLLQLTPLLESWRLAISGAVDLDEAMEVLEDEPECRTVLLDSAVLGENPCDTIQTIRTGIRSRPAIILMSGNCSGNASPDCMRLVEDCIDLPVDPEQLKDVLESHLAEPETAQNG